MISKAKSFGVHRSPDGLVRLLSICFSPAFQIDKILDKVKGKVTTLTQEWVQRNLSPKDRVEVANVYGMSVLYYRLTVMFYPGLRPITIRAVILNLGGAPSRGWVSNIQGSTLIILAILLT